MRKSNIVALATLTILLIAPSKQVKAQSFSFNQQQSVTKQTDQLKDLNKLFGYKLIVEKPEPKKEVPQKPKPKPEPPKPVEYTVVEGDSLTKIAEANNTTWQRLWQKNTQLTNQDSLNIGDKLTVPLPDEVLAERPTNTPVLVQNVSEAPRTAQTRQYVGSSSGNTYSTGYCTWYAKSRRPDLPNLLGNAGEWYGNAQGAGLATGTTPRVGSIGVSFGGAYGHVVYVEAVSGATITVSEMNFQGWNVVSSRTTSASAFVYIY